MEKKVFRVEKKVFNGWSSPFPQDQTEGSTIEIGWRKAKIKSDLQFTWTGLSLYYKMEKTDHPGMWSKNFESNDGLHNELSDFSGSLYEHYKE